MVRRLLHATLVVASRSLRLLVLAAPALAACGGGGAAQSQSSAPLCAAEGVDPATHYGPAPLRRLTRFEYGRALADLTGVDPAIALNLPPDEETLGFDDIAAAYSVSTLHAARYLDVAEEAAAALAADGARVRAFAGCDPIAGDADCRGAFLEAFGLRAWRRPLEPDEKTALDTLFVETSDPGPRDGLTATVAVMLQSPQLVYRPELPAASPRSGDVDGLALATRLSFLLTGAPPDADLLAAALRSDLDANDGLLVQTDRLLAGERATELFVHFAKQWWELGALATLDKDRSLYRTWTDAMPAAFGQETTLFLGEAWRNGADLPSLLTSPVTFVNGALASFYGMAPPAGSAFGRVTLPEGRGAGLLTQGSFLATHAKADQTSPVLRGRFVRTQLLCSPPPPPPADVAITPPSVDPRLTTRQRFAQHTADDSCASCHRLMDPIGFVFEHFDAAGRWRDIDGGQAIDATSELTGTDVDGPLDGVPSLAARLAESEQVASCVATQWFRYAFGRREGTTGDSCAILALAGALRGPAGDFKSMVRATVRLAAFRAADPSGGASP